MRLRTLSVAAVTAVGLGASLLTAGIPGSSAASAPTTSAAPAPAAARAAAPTAPPFTLVAPRRAEAYSEGGNGPVWGNYGISLKAGAQPIEVWSKRPAWNRRIQTQLKVGSTTRVLPVGSVKNFNGFPGFLQVRVKNAAGKQVLRRDQRVCFAGTTQRAVPSAPARSPYPTQCPAPYGFVKGGVQGIQAGWTTNVSENLTLRLKKGTYTIDARIAPKYVKLFGLKPATSRTTTKLKVLTFDYEGGMRTKDEPAPALEAGIEPRGMGANPVSGPVPDLQSLPAWGMRISPNGNYLEFAATVWNAGNSPLVIDGFRKGNRYMKTYQYFFDKDGEQTGYRDVGMMHWHNAPSHMHWHLMDFARYSLLSANKKEVVRSRKQSFCLANTDATDYTVPGADWQPDQTDLDSSCGGFEAQSIRQTLAAGSGDTYDQSRAGQSFSLKGLKNGVYYIQVLANPTGNLTEANTKNNSALRKIRIGGKPGKRTVTFAQVGNVKEPSFFF